MGGRHPPVIAIQVQLDVNRVDNLSYVMKRLVSFHYQKKKKKGDKSDLESHP